MVASNQHLYHKTVSCVHANFTGAFKFTKTNMQFLDSEVKFNIVIAVYVTSQLAYTAANHAMAIHKHVLSGFI